jgi:DNA invertase Pin-like site-specific DNA recombinase
MAARNKQRGLVYLRRSTDRQETSLQAQLEWARAASARQQVRLDASVADLEWMRAHRLSSYKDLRLDDGRSGADLTRPGFVALQQDALADPAVSHLFIYRRDRLARPEEAAAMLLIENGLARAGITLVFCDHVAPPLERGQTDLARDVSVLLNYHESGDFLNKLAERVLLAQRQLARDGFRTGGNAPYGFARVLVDASGQVLEELVPGRRVRQAGCHVRIVPKDEAKIQVWLYVLDLKYQGWGHKRIAQHLNALGIPSPGAGRVRTDQGARHVVSGRWSASTVRELCDNRAILGIQDFGRRSEGAHRRLGANGPRLLDDADRTPSDKPKVVLNDPSLIVSAATGSAARFDVERWEAIQEQQLARGRAQRGVPRAKDPARYPLSCRLVDLTDGCGAILYGRLHGQRPLYVCGRYARTEGAECHNNAVDGEAVLRFTLNTLRQLLERQGNRDQLRQALLERARQAQPDRLPSPAEAGVHVLEERCEQLRSEWAVVQRRMAREKDDARYEAMAAEFDRIRQELASAEKELQGKPSHQTRTAAWTPEEEVDKALAVLDDVERITADGSARADVNPLLRRLGVRLGLTFGSAVKGKKRVVRRLLGGLMTFGDAELPVKPHGLDHVPPAGGSARAGEAGSAITQFDAGAAGRENGEKAAPTRDSREGKEGKRFGSSKRCRALVGETRRGSMLQHRSPPHPFRNDPPA